MKRLLTVCLFLPQFFNAQQISQNDCIPWPATDGLGRHVSQSGQTRTVQKEKFAGIFYFIWHPTHDDTSKASRGPFNITEILKKNPNAMNDYYAWNYEIPDTNKSYFEQTMHWNEPLFGYYYLDSWVLRKHANLLTDAGIDVIIFDATNAATYRNTYFRLCKEFMELRQMGEKTPQIAFMLNTEVKKTANELWEDLYKEGHYKELWFIWKGKPLIVADPKEVDPALLNFFTFRKAYWPDLQGKNHNTNNQWQWEVPFPQPYSYDKDSARPEYLNVSVAQNLSRFDGSVTIMSQGKARGRSFHEGIQPTGFLPPYPDITKYGKNVQEQWNRALDVDPEFIFITGWNEWIVGRGVNHPWWGKGAAQFCDQFSDEFSRDIEMSRGELADHYYYQMINNIRKFKGVGQTPVNNAIQTIYIGKSFNEWDKVSFRYQDHAGDIIHRNSRGYGDYHYINNTGRNDIIWSKVTSDKKNVYFFVQTKDALTPATGKNWMWLFIDADQDHATGFEGYDFAINRENPLNGLTTIDRYIDHTWKEVGKVALAWDKNMLHVAIPLSYLKISPTQFSIDFKWVDNMQNENDVMDFYISGDVAPEGRFNYRYTFSR